MVLRAVLEQYPWMDPPAVFGELKPPNFIRSRETLTKMRVIDSRIKSPWFNPPFVLNRFILTFLNQLNSNVISHLESKIAVNFDFIWGKFDIDIMKPPTAPLIPPGLFSTGHFGAVPDHPFQISLSF